MDGAGNGFSKLQTVGITTGFSLASGLLANNGARDTLGSSVSSFGKTLCSIPGSLVNTAMSGINGVRNQTFNVASYLVPSLKPLAERQVALPGFLRPVLGGASGTASMGTLVLAGMTPMYYVAKTGVTTCQRYLQSRAQNHRVDHALNGAHRDSVAALDHAELALQADRRRYKTLAQRSVLPTWTQLLMAAVPGILLAPELGAAALVVGAVAGASQVASNLWERSANKGMVQETQKNINHVTTKRDLLNARRDLYLMGKRMDRLEALHPELRGQ